MLGRRFICVTHGGMVWGGSWGNGELSTPGEAEIGAESQEGLDFTSHSQVPLQV